MAAQPCAVATRDDGESIGDGSVNVNKRRRPAFNGLDGRLCARESEVGQPFNEQNEEAHDILIFVWLMRNEAIVMPQSALCKRIVAGQGRARHDKNTIPSRQRVTQTAANSILCCGLQ